MFLEKMIRSLERKKSAHFYNRSNYSTRRMEFDTRSLGTKSQMFNVSVDLPDKIILSVSISKHFMTSPVMGRVVLDGADVWAHEFYSGSYKSVDANSLKLEKNGTLKSIDLLFLKIDSVYSGEHKLQNDCVKGIPFKVGEVICTKPFHTLPKDTCIYFVKEGLNNIHWIHDHTSTTPLVPYGGISVNGASPDNIQQVYGIFSPITNVKRQIYFVTIDNLNNEAQANDSKKICFAYSMTEQEKMSLGDFIRSNGINFKIKQQNVEYVSTGFICDPGLSDSINIIFNIKGGKNNV